MGSYTVADLLRKNRSARVGSPTRTAITFRGESFTYAELEARSNRLAAALLGEGFRHGDRVAIVLHNCVEYFDVFFAVAKLGGVAVPINYMLRAREVEFLLDDSGASWVFFEEGLRSILGGLDDSDATRTYIGLGVDHAAASPNLRYEDLLAGDETELCLPTGYVVTINDLLLLQYTSGTTGNPKGAMHTHSTVMWNSFHQIVDYQVTADDVFMVVPSLCWAAGMHDLTLASLWLGGRLVLNPSTGFDTAEFIATLAREQVTATLLVPTVLKRVLQDPSLVEQDLSALRLVCSGGEPVPVTSMELAHELLPDCNLLQVYGMSEFPTMMMYVGPEDALRKLGSTGKAASACEIRIVDENGVDVAPGEIGEIISRSPANTIGYYNKEAATAATLRDGWMHTGDLATMDDEGFVFVSGRSKDMIITGGLNVYPAEVERVIAAHPAVLEVAVVGQVDDRWGEIGIACIVLAEGAELDDETLKEYLSTELATYKVPKRFVMSHEALPRTTSGKVQKFKLKETLT